MSDEIPYRPRRRRSMDSLSTLDTPAPPYGLVDPAYRPGSIRSIPVPSGDGRPPSSLRSGYRMRVGKLEVRFADRWDSLPEEAQILELDAVDRVLPPELTAIIALFENAIKRGHTILCLLGPFYTSISSDTSIGVLYRRLRTIWDLRINVGAALCEYEGTVPQQEIDRLSTRMAWICDSLLHDAIEKAHQRGLSDAFRAAPGGLPAPTARQRKVLETLARDMNKKNDQQMEWVTQSLTQVDLKLRLERFEE